MNKRPLLTLYRPRECILPLATDGEIQFLDLLAVLLVGLRYLSSGNTENGSGIEVLLQLGVTRIQKVLVSKRMHREVGV